MPNAMQNAEVDAGTLDYCDDGAGPLVVLVHGAWMNSTQWDPVVELLTADFRCVRPVLPLGAHRRAMRPEADLSLRGQARIIADFLDALDLDDVTLVFNDWCAAQIMIAEGWYGRVARMVLVSCETDDNYPPGLPGRVLDITGKTPGALAMAAQALRFRAFRQLPFTFGRMSHQAIPRDVAADWFGPARTNRDVRRDFQRYIRDTKNGRAALVAATPALEKFDTPVLVAWGADDVVMPLRCGRRLASTFPNNRFVEIPNARTLVPWDQPERLATEIRQFMAEERS